MSPEALPISLDMPTSCSPRFASLPRCQNCCFWFHIHSLLVTTHHTPRLEASLCFPSIHPHQSRHIGAQRCLGPARCSTRCISRRVVNYVVSATRQKKIQTFARPLAPALADPKNCELPTKISGQRRTARGINMYGELAIQ